MTLALIFISAFALASQSEQSDFDAAVAVIRFEVAQSGIDSTPTCIEVSKIDVGARVAAAMSDTRLHIVPMAQGCSWMKLFDSVKKVDGQWLVHYGNYGYCEDRDGGCVNAGKAMSAVLEPAGNGWRVVRLIGGVNL